MMQKWAKSKHLIKRYANLKFVTEIRIMSFFSLSSIYDHNRQCSHYLRLIALLVRKKEFIWLFISENSLKKYELENILSQNKIYGIPKSQRR